jgi:hypothetical protein
MYSVPSTMIGAVSWPRASSVSKRQARANRFTLARRIWSSGLKRVLA